jgi:flagellar motor component MotA
MIRYLVSLIVLLTGVVLTIFTSGGALWPYIDIPSLIIVGIFPFLFVSIVFGFKRMKSAFSAALKNESEKNKLIEALVFFNAYSKTIWVSGFIAVLIGVIAMLVWLEDKTKFGPNLAVALISLLYCGIISIAIIIPFTIGIKKQLKKD